MIIVDLCGWSCGQFSPGESKPSMWFRGRVRYIDMRHTTFVRMWNYALYGMWGWENRPVQFHPGRTSILDCKICLFYRRMVVFSALWSVVFEQVCTCIWRLRSSLLSLRASPLPDSPALSQFSCLDQASASGLKEMLLGSWASSASSSFRYIYFSCFSANWFVA